MDADEMMYRRGERDGRGGFNPSSTSAEYMKGWVQGRRIRLEQALNMAQACKRVDDCES